MAMKVAVFVCLIIATAASRFGVRRTVKRVRTAEENEELGILKPAHNNTNIIPGYIIDLLPEMIAASTQVKSTNVFDTMMAYMPFARKIMEKQSPNGRLSSVQEQLLQFTERVVPPMMRMVQTISVGDGFNDSPLNIIPDEEFTTVMIRMLPDIASIINDMKAQYGGWPGTNKALEIMDAFMPLTRKATQYQAEFQGRQITSEEDKYLTFAEKVVPPIMDYVQTLYGKTYVPRQANQIQQLVMTAVEELKQ